MLTTLLWTIVCIVLYPIVVFLTAKIATYGACCGFAVFTELERRKKDREGI